MTDFNRGTLRVDLADYALAQVIINLSDDPDQDAENLRDALNTAFDVFGVTEDGKRAFKARVQAAIAGQGSRQAPSTASPQNGAQRQPRARSGGSGLTCPDHDGVELVESKPEYQEYSFLPDGTKRPDKFFCPGAENGTGKNHSVWRSRAVVGSSQPAESQDSWEGDAQPPWEGAEQTPVMSGAGARDEVPFPEETPAF